MKNTFENQLIAVISEYESARSRAKYDDLSDIYTITQATNLQTRCITAIERTSGLNSTYSKDVERRHIAQLIGIAKALLSDIQNNFMESFEELLHGDTFSNFLEMSSHLLEKKYKDPAAVLAGSTLEVHLRNLCNKYSVTATSKGKPKKADALNAELKIARIYTLSDQKQITAWLAIRNDAAHGNYEKYTKEQVQLLIDGVRNFITRYPA